MEGEYDIYDSRNGELLWRGVLESPDGQVAYPDGITPAEVVRDLTHHPILIFIDRTLRRWRRFGRSS